jgi:hypothetical protein
VIEILNLPADGVARQPGMYRMDAATYHRDPCPAPSLSSSTIKTMLERTPRHAWCDHPKLGNMRADKSSDAFTIGTAAHKLILGAGAEFCVIDAADWRTKDAQAQRDQARADGLTPILREQHDKAQHIAAWSRGELNQLPLVADAFADGLPELVAIWREGDIWCRSMMDLAPTAADAEGWWTIYDLKTTSGALDANALARNMINFGYDIQAAHYTRGLQALLGDDARVRFRFLFVESDSPYSATVAQCSGLMASTGEQKVLAAYSIWSRGLRENEWPGYPRDLMRVEPPNFLETQWRDREAGDPLIVGALNHWSKAA